MGLCELRGQPGVHKEVQVSQGYMVIPISKNKQTNKKTLPKRDSSQRSEGNQEVWQVRGTR